MKPSGFLRREEKKLHFSPLVKKVLRELEPQEDESDVEDSQATDIPLQRTDSRAQSSEVNDVLSELKVERAEIEVQTDEPQKVQSLVPTLSFQYTDETDLMTRLDKYLRMALKQDDFGHTRHRDYPTEMLALDLRTEREQRAALADLKEWREALRHTLES